MKNISEAFSFPFKDPDWVSKALIGGIFTLLSIILIGIPVLYGYYIELVQRLRRHEQNPLPEWSELGVKFIVGVKFLITLFVYYLPLIIIMFPILIIVAIASIQESHMAGMFGGAALLTVIFLVVIPYSLFMSVLTPIISVEYAEKESMGDGLQVGKILKLFKVHWQDCLIATLITIGVGILASVGIIFFIVGILFTSFYASLVRFHLYGQIAQTIHQPSPRTSDAA